MMKAVVASDSRAQATSEYWISSSRARSHDQRWSSDPAPVNCGGIFPADTSNSASLARNQTLTRVTSESNKAPVAGAKAIPKTPVGTNFQRKTRPPNRWFGGR